MNDFSLDNQENNYGSTGSAEKVKRTVFYENTVFHGNIELETELEIRGEHFGNIESKSLVIISGVVEGNIKAAQIKISSGTINGNIQAYNHMEIEAESMITGDILCDSLSSAGSVTGNIKCTNTVKFIGKAKLFGDCVGANLCVSDGVVIEGQVKIG